MAEFNPNDIGIANGNYFALPVDVDECDTVIVRVPWDVTVSYSDGTAKGPEAMLEASTQIDLFDINTPQAWMAKIATVPLGEELIPLNNIGRESAKKVISALESGADKSTLCDMIDEVNALCGRMVDYVYSTSKHFLEQGKLVGIAGGEHSVPLGLIQALGERYSDFGILHIDAHADLRDAYEGFKYSHASIMFNAISSVPQITSLVQVAIRDFCNDEFELIQRDERITAFPDFVIQKALFEGNSWSSVCDKILASLPENVYISFDIDGLTPEYCPSTGTPVPGGINFSQAEYLLYKFKCSGKRLIGFDLSEVAPSESGEWDANVGARLLYKLSLINR